MTRGVGGLIQAADYNNIRDKVVLVMGTGATGYGQTDLSSSSVSVDTEISEVRWDALRTDLLRARQHQTGVDETANITNAANTTVITEAIFAQYDTYSTTVTTNNRVCADNQRAVEALISSTPWTSNWNGILYHQVVVTFSTALQAKYFFNAGGQIRFNASRTGTAANTKDTEWTNMLGNATTPSGMGTIFFDYTQTGTVAGTAAVGRQGTGSTVGFYDLTTTSQQIFITTATSSSYLANDYNIKAKVNTAFGSGTEPTTITFTIEFRDDAGGNPDEQVTGTLNSICQMARPSGSNVSITAPIASQTSLTTSVISGASPPEPTYSWTRSVTSRDEGGGFSITFNTNQAGNFAYTITGVTSTDLSGASLTGIVSNGTVLTYTVAADATLEGTETFTIALDNGQASTSVTINDTSIPPTPTYSFTRSVASVTEGQSFTVTFNTNQAGNFAYAITGVTSADLGGASLTGFVTNGTVLTYTAAADATTEGAETFTIALVNGLASTSVTINDTIIPAYTLTRSVASVNEGQSFTVTFNTNQPGNFTYTITGVQTEDFAPGGLPQGFLGFVTNGTVLTYTIAADAITEGAQTFTLSLDNGLASTSVLINDTSQSAGPTYTLTRSVASVNEGQSFTVTFTTSQAGNFPYTITGVSPQDISGASLTGIVSNNTTLTFNVANDLTLEGTETFTLSLDNGQASTSVTINDTSTPAPTPTYTWTRSANTVNEGQSFTVTFATNQPGSFAYDIAGVSNADIGGAALGGFITNGTVLTFTTTADATTEGNETFIISATEIYGTTPLVQAQIIINDTSTAPLTINVTGFKSYMTRGLAHTVTFTATGGVAPYSMAINGQIPAPVTTAFGAATQTYSASAGWTMSSLGSPTYTYNVTVVDSATSPNATSITQTVKHVGLINGTTFIQNTADTRNYTSPANAFSLPVEGGNSRRVVVGMKYGLRADPPANNALSLSATMTMPNGVVYPLTYNEESYTTGSSRIYTAIYSALIPASAGATGTLSVTMTDPTDTTPGNRQFVAWTLVGASDSSGAVAVDSNDTYAQQFVAPWSLPQQGPNPQGYIPYVACFIYGSFRTNGTAVTVSNGSLSNVLVNNITPVNADWRTYSMAGTSNGAPTQGAITIASVTSGVVSASYVICQY